ncbi:MAG: hypothetical protein ACTSRK_21220 [Promethearchaeota archaeon]
MGESYGSKLDKLSLECSRCGRCCREFEGQIHFQPSAPFLIQSTEKNSDSFHPWVQLYFQIFMDLRSDLPASSDPESKKIQHSASDSAKSLKFRYNVPSKRQIWSIHPSEAAEYLPPSSRDSPDCLFLDYSTDNHTPFCIIHGQHPKMCDEYPKSKGFVCKNHPERKYTIGFLEYQREKIGFAVKLLNQIYGDEIQETHAFDLLALLMDFGVFSALATKNFFQVQFGISEQEWESMLEKLDDLQLISLKEDEMTGISITEIEYLVDRVMKERKWN